MAYECDIDELNAKYPCDQRLGYGKGCDCENGKAHKALIKCNYQGRQLRCRMCTQCKYQKKYAARLDK